MPWSNQPGTQRDLPANWSELRAACERRAGGRCEWIMPSGRRCPRQGSEADHYGKSWQHHLLRWLCAEHHKEHTQAQSRQARTRKPRIRRQRHPGSLA